MRRRTVYILVLVDEAITYWRGEVWAILVLVVQLLLAASVNEKPEGRREGTTARFLK